MLIEVLKPLPETPREIEMIMDQNAFEFFGMKAKFDTSLRKLEQALQDNSDAPKVTLEHVYARKSCDQYVTGFILYCPRGQKSIDCFIDILIKTLTAANITYNIEERPERYFIAIS